MKNTKFNVFTFFFILILALIKPNLCIGQTYFFDNFSDPSLSKWEFVAGSVGSSSWYVSDSVLNGKVGTGGYSFLYPLSNGSSLTDYTVEADIRSISGVDDTFFVRVSDDRSKYFQIGFRFADPGWPQDNNNITLHKVFGSNYWLLASYPSIQFPRNFDLTQNTWHKIKIVLLGSNIKIYFNGVLAVNYTYTGSGLSVGGVGLLNWGGDFGGDNYRQFDNFKIRDNVEEQDNKIIILPGLGASWNEKAMVFNQAVVQSEWKMTPFVHNYDSLMGALEQNGLVKNSDYFVWNYDWRKPLSEIVTDFNTYVAGLGINDGDQVDLVGHSLGGLVGRIWTQENPEKVNKVINLGSPQSGAVSAYEAWSGAKVGDRFNVQSIALNVLLQLQKKNNQNLVETVRSYAKILKDLLPTFDYLKVNGKVKIPPVNLYLSNKNAAVLEIFDKFMAIVGKSELTKEWINLGERSVFDKILGLWEQGKPLSYQYGSGDGTVLKKSAKFEGDVYMEIESDHGLIPDKSVNLVLSELGLGETIVEVATNADPMAVFYLGSPAEMIVNCGGVGITDSDGWVTAANKNIADCGVNLLGTENGTYHLVMGNSSDDNSWQYSEGQIGVGETKNISIVDKNYWYDQVLRETDVLLDQFNGNSNLLKMKTAAEGKNFNNLMSAYLAFRKEKRETKITLNIVNYLEKILGIEKAVVSSIELEKTRINALSFKSLADKTALLLQRKRINPTTWQSLNYNQAEGLLSSPSYARYFLAGKIFEIVWK
jgi:pimeloyl-ACP methyl ester carboxylesterase